jgi:glycerol-3-phosphate acyltransferase PlsX
MRIIVDVMGGDSAPVEIVKGALAASHEYDVDILLVGDRENIKKITSKNPHGHVEICHTEKILTMEDRPSCILHEKKDSSMGLAFKLLIKNEGDALVSVGNTGALNIGSTNIVGCLPGIERPALGVLLPFENPTLLIDAGANLEVRPEHLKQFAIMGSIYMEKFLGYKNPTVGLANIGKEKNKGPPLLVETYNLLSESNMVNFIGNIEGHKMFTHCSDVLLADGFTGNIILKLTEGFRMFLRYTLKELYTKDMFIKMVASKMYSFNEYDGAPLFGLRYPVIKAHGSANAETVKNAVRRAMFLLEADVIGEIDRQLHIMFKGLKI